MKASKSLKPIMLAVLTLALAWAIAPQAYAVDPYYVPNYGTQHGYYSPIGSNGGTIEAELFNKDNVTTRQPVVDTRNSGNNWTGYYGGDDSTEWGNQGNEHNYREDEAVIDIDVFYETDEGSTGNFIRCKGSYEWVNYVLDVEADGWYRILFYMRAEGDTGWAYVDYIAIDDMKYAGADMSYMFLECPRRDDMPIYLTAGSHNLKVRMSAQYGVLLDYIKFERVSAPSSLPAPRLITPNAQLGFSYPDKIIADAVVTDTQWNGGADPTGSSDATQAIQTAMDEISKYGGGTVFIPSGTYKIGGRYDSGSGTYKMLTLPGNITLRGEWAPPINSDGTSGDGSGKGTILKATYDTPGISNSTPFIHHFGGYLQYLSIWYPSQTIPTTGTSWTPTAYDWTIYADPSVGSNAHASNVTLYNSYKGIYQYGSCFNLYMTALDSGVFQYGCGGGRDIFNMWLQNAIWEVAPSPINSTAMNQTQKNFLADYTNANLVAWLQGRSDGGCHYNINLEEPDGSRTANIGVVARRWWGDWSDTTDDEPIIPHHTFAGMKLKADMVGIGAFNQNEVPFNLDTLVPSDKNYTFSASKYPYTTAAGYYWKSTTNNFYNVKTQYNAKGDGALVEGSDDTDEIQQALYDAGTAGGGTVYLPSGQYVISEPLSIPPNVELRGSGVGASGDASGERCALLACCGVVDYTTTPFITLQSNASYGSGVSNFTVVYPVQGYADSANYPTLPRVEQYPATIQGGGSKVWVKEVAAFNAYDFLDFATNQCDDHLLSGTGGCTFHNGNDIGGGSNDGIAEFSGFSFYILGYSPRVCSPWEVGQVAWDAVYSYIHYDGEVYPQRFGTCYNEKAFGLGESGATTGFLIYDDGDVGCQGLEMFYIGADGAGPPGAALDVEKGGQITPISVFDAPYNPLTLDTPWVRLGSNFSGTLNLYTGRSSSDAPVEPHAWSVGYGTFNLYCEKGAAFGRPVWANSQCYYDMPAAAAEHVNDGFTSPSTFNRWTGDTMDSNPPGIVDPDAHWVRIDLGQPTDLTRWMMYTTGFQGLDTAGAYDTLDASFDISTNGVDWTEIDTYEPYNRWGTQTYCNIWDNVVGATPGASRHARYIRLRVPHGTQSGGDDYARVPEFIAYARDEKGGWQFSDGTTQSWSAQTGCTLSIESFGSHGTVGGAEPDPPYGYTKRLKINTTATSPVIQSPDHLSINSYRYNAVKVRLSNWSSCTSMKLQWTTQCDTTWNDAKSKVISSVTADWHKYKEYTFDSLPTTWKGTIKQLRLTFTGAVSSKTIKLASISLVDPASPVSYPGFYESFTDYTDGLAASGGSSANQGALSQGFKGCWYYQDLTGSQTTDASYTTLTSKVYTTAYNNLTWEKSYAASYKLHVSDSWQRPVRYNGTHCAVRKWVAPAGGTIDISGTAWLEPSQSNVTLYIRKRTAGGSWSLLYGGTTLSGSNTLYPAYNDVSISKGDAIYFIVEPTGATNSQNFKTNWLQGIQYK